jgi:YegS/Rv2252/BmrU family lipid kinase
MHAEPITREFLLVVSPTAGGGAAKQQAPALVQALRAAGFSVEAEYTESLGHASELAAGGARAGRTVVAVGGDGLINSVVNGIAGVEGATLGVVPLGTANDLARSLGIDKHNAVEVLKSGRVSVMDLGYAAGRYFTCIASVGFDSRVIESSVQTRFLRGPLLYPYCVLKTLISWKPQRLTVRSDGDDYTFDGFSIAVANGPCYGDGMLLAPDARMDDGMFDVVIIDTTSKLEFLRWAPRIFKGRHLGSKAVRLWRTDRVVIETAEPFLVYADGEPLAPAPLELEARRDALRILRP